MLQTVFALMVKPARNHRSIRDPSSWLKLSGSGTGPAWFRRFDLVRLICLSLSIWMIGWSWGCSHLPTELHLQSKASLTSPQIKLPRRSALMPTASQLQNSLTKYNLVQRERVIVEQILAGNIPDFLRDLVPIQVSLTSGAVATIFVTKDYLSLGSNQDFVRIPLSLPAALQISNHLSMALPSKAVVDAIYQQARYIQKPVFFSPSASMTTVPTFYRHNRIVSNHFRQYNYHNLVAGHKKDILMPRYQADSRITIYGWHQPTGRPIQPVSRVHKARYVDYSHGLRLIYDKALIGGRWVAYRDIIAKIASIPYKKPGRHQALL